MNAIHTHRTNFGRVLLRTAGWLLLALTTCAVAQIPSYNIYNLGTLGTGLGSAARGVNNASVVAGQSHTGTQQHAFRWQLNTDGVGVMTDLGVLQGTSDSDGANIAPAGSLVVGTSDTQPVFFLGGGVGSLPGIGDVPRGIAFAAKGGTVVGHLNRLIPGWGIIEKRAVKWRNNKATELHPAISTISQATDINANGECAGWASATAFGPPHAMRWGGGPTADVHGGFTGKVNSHGLALNNDGTVVGMAFSAASATDAVPFRAKLGGGMALLVLPVGTPRGRALDINKDGSMVGFGEPGSVALLWPPDTAPMEDPPKVKLLQNLIPAGSGWTLRSATSINDKGEIAGWGILAGQTRAFLLRPTTYNPCVIQTEIIDPSAPEPPLGYRLLTDEEITTDKTKLASGGVPAIGLVSDGTTRLLLRFTASDPGTITINFPVAGDDDEQSATGLGEQDGWLGMPGSKPMADSLTLTTTVIGGKHVAFAVYRAPEEMPPDVHGAATRNITLKLHFDGPSGKNSINNFVTLRVDRPPLLAMHGLWSSFDGAYGGGFTSGIQAGIPGIVVEGPSYPNANSFTYNGREVTQYIRKLREDRRREKIAMCQADVVGHSMGGLLGRRWAGDPVSRVAANYKEGEVNRLITIDSPHCGAILMAAAWELRQLYDALPGDTVRDALDQAFRELGLPISDGAVEDLSIGSAAIGLLTSSGRNTSHVPCHSIAGDWTLPVDLTSTAQTGILAPFYALLGRWGAAVTGNIPVHSDLLVGLENQLGGLVVPATTINDHKHDGAANQPEVIAACVGLLRARPSSSFFAAGFPIGCPPSPPLVSGTIRTLRELRLVLSSPVSGAIISAGTNLVVSVVNEAESKLKSLLIDVGNTIFEVLIDPWEIEIPVPPPLIGDVSVSVIGTHADGSISLGTRMVHVVTSASLNVFTATPAAFTLYSYDSHARASLQGTYSDGIKRHLTNAATGTTYLSSNPSVVTVNGDGWLTPVANGTATVTATHGAKTAPIAVTVALVPESDLALAGSVAPLTMIAGESAVISFTATNHGPAPARPVNVFLHSPPGIVLTGTTASSGAWNNNVGPVWSIAALSAPGSSTLTASVTALTPGSGTLTVTITGAEPDFAATNNLLSIPVRIFADPQFAFTAGGGSVHFLTEPGVTYIVETSPDIAPGNWTPVTSIPGDGTEKTFPVSALAQRLFHRLRLITH